MNLSSFIGISLGISVMYLALSHTSENIGMFLDFHGILIVMGGTIAAASISFPLLEILALIKVFVLRILGRNHVNYAETINQILELNKKAASGEASLTELAKAIKHPFLKEGIILIGTGILTEQELKATLDRRLKTFETEYMRGANMFRTIGKFPPAFGLLATTLGMIALLQKIGQPDSQKLIGPAMSIGLIGTLYGITLANLVFIPIAENLAEKTHEEIALRKMIIDGLLLLKAKVNPITLRERLNSYVLPKKRVTKKAT